LSFGKFKAAKMAEAKSVAQEKAKLQKETDAKLLQQRLAQAEDLAARMPQGSILKLSYELAMMIAARQNELEMMVEFDASPEDQETVKAVLNELGFLSDVLAKKLKIK
jgi:adenylate cyclase class IV